MVYIMCPDKVPTCVPSHFKDFLTELKNFKLQINENFKSKSDEELVTENIDSDALFNCSYLSVPLKCNELLNFLLSRKRQNVTPPSLLKPPKLSPDYRTTVKGRDQDQETNTNWKLSGEHNKQDAHSQSRVYFVGNLNLEMLPEFVMRYVAMFYMEDNLDSQETPVAEDFWTTLSWWWYNNKETADDLFFFAYDILIESKTPTQLLLWLLKGKEVGSTYCDISLFRLICKHFGATLYQYQNWVVTYSKAYETDHFVYMTKHVLETQHNPVVIEHTSADNVIVIAIMQHDPRLHLCVRHCSNELNCLRMLQNLHNREAVDKQNSPHLSFQNAPCAEEKSRLGVHRMSFKNRIISMRMGAAGRKRVTETKTFNLHGRETRMAPQFEATSRLLEDVQAVFDEYYSDIDQYGLIVLRIPRKDLDKYCPTYAGNNRHGQMVTQADRSFVGYKRAEAVNWTHLKKNATTTSRDISQNTYVENDIEIDFMIQKLSKLVPKKIYILEHSLQKYPLTRQAASISCRTDFENLAIDEDLAKTLQKIEANRDPHKRCLYHVELNSPLVAKKGWISLEAICSKNNPLLSKYRLTTLGGISTWQDYFSPGSSLFSVHTEDDNYPSVNFMAGGSGKRWWCVPAFYFYDFMEWLYVEIGTIDSTAIKCENHTHHKLYFINPSAVPESIPLTTWYQEAGDIVITGPAAFHWGINVEPNFCTSINVVSSQWTQLYFSKPVCLGVEGCSTNLTMGTEMLIGLLQHYYKFTTQIDIGFGQSKRLFAQSPSHDYGDGTDDVEDRMNECYGILLPAGSTSALDSEQRLELSKSGSSDFSEDRELDSQNAMSTEVTYDVDNRIFEDAVTTPHPRNQTIPFLPKPLGPYGKVSTPQNQSTENSTAAYSQTRADIDIEFDNELNEHLNDSIEVIQTPDLEHDDERSLDLIITDGVRKSPTQNPPSSSLEANIFVSKERASKYKSTNKSTKLKTKPKTNTNSNTSSKNTFWCDTCKFKFNGGRGSHMMTRHSCYECKICHKLLSETAFRRHITRSKCAKDLEKLLNVQHITGTDVTSAGVKLNPNDPRYVEWELNAKQYWKTNN